MKSCYEPEKPLFMQKIQLILIDAFYINPYCSQQMKKPKYKYFVSALKPHMLNVHFLHLIMLSYAHKFVFWYILRTCVQLEAALIFWNISGHNILFLTSERDIMVLMLWWGSCRMQLGVVIVHPERWWSNNTSNHGCSSSNKLYRGGKNSPFTGSFLSQGIIWFHLISQTVPLCAENR